MEGRQILLRNLKREAHSHRSLFGLTEKKRCKPTYRVALNLRLLCQFVSLRNDELY